MNSKKFKIEKKSYGGIIGFELRKIIPKIGSECYLTVKRKLANKNGKKFINKIILEKDKIYPSIVSIETVNKCNGTCSFCGCNINSENRKFKLMEDSLYEKIINDLSENEFDGLLMVVMNNEPFIDKKIIEKLRIARKKLPKATMKLISNGTIISIEQFEIINNENLLDELVLNNYNTTMKLNDNLQKIYDRFKDEMLNIKVEINLRYSGEILSNRANSSPNKFGQKEIKEVCTLPFTDFNINPYGISTLCCCDTKEKTNFGNLNTQSISEIFNGEKYKKIREKMKDGRNENTFCMYCDFIDAGMRQEYIRRKINEK